MADRSEGGTWVLSNMIIIKSFMHHPIPNIFIYKIIIYHYYSAHFWWVSYDSMPSHFKQQYKPLTNLAAIKIRSVVLTELRTPLLIFSHQLIFPSAKFRFIQ